MKIKMSFNSAFCLSNAFHATNTFFIQCDIALF